MTEEEIEKMDQDVLDNLVIDCKCHEASTINNAGKDSQVEFLIEWLGEKGFRKEYEERTE